MSPIRAADPNIYVHEEERYGGRGRAHVRASCAHYEIEKGLAARLRSANREDRKRLYGELYEFFIQSALQSDRLDQGAGLGACSLYVDWHLS